MGADLNKTKHFGNFFFGFFSFFFFSLHENPFKHFTIIPFWIHRFFSQRKILMIRIFDLILDFSKETHPQINITTIIVIIIIIINSSSSKTISPSSTLLAPTPPSTSSSSLSSSSSSSFSYSS